MWAMIYVNGVWGLRVKLFMS